jgi:hypothetical protein
VASTPSLVGEGGGTAYCGSSVTPPRLARAWRRLVPAASRQSSLGAASGRWFKSGARNHLPANRPFGFRFEIAV